MTPEERKLLEETRAFAKESHRMLRAMRRHQIYSLIGTVLIWVVVLSVPLYLYQTYLQPFVATFSEATGLPASGPLGLPTSADIQKLINSFKVQ